MSSLLHRSENHLGRDLGHRGRLPRSPDRSVREIRGSLHARMVAVRPPRPAVLPVLYQLVLGTYLRIRRPQGLRSFGVRSASLSIIEMRIVVLESTSCCNYEAHGFLYCWPRTFRLLIPRTWTVLLRDHYVKAYQRVCHLMSGLVLVLSLPSVEFIAAPTLGFRPDLGRIFPARPASHAQLGEPATVKFQRFDYVFTVPPGWKFGGSSECRRSLFLRTGSDHGRPEVLQVVRDGYRLQLARLPPLTPRPDGRVFLVYKAIACRWCLQPSTSFLVTFLQWADWLIKFGLRDAYLHVWCTWTPAPLKAFAFPVDPSTWLSGRSRAEPVSSGFIPGRQLYHTSS